MATFSAVPSVLPDPPRPKSTVQEALKGKNRYKQEIPTSTAPGAERGQTRGEFRIDKNNEYKYYHQMTY